MSNFRRSDLPLVNTGSAGRNRLARSARCPARAELPNCRRDTQLTPVGPTHIDTTGRQLVLTRAGSGAPTFVLETGLGAEGEEWEPVFQAVKHWRDPARNQEGVDFPASQAQTHAIDSLGDIPMLVLTSGVFLREAPPEPAAQQLAAQLHVLWQEMHRELMQQSSSATQIVVETSGHFILLKHKNELRVTKPPWLLQHLTHVIPAPIGRLLGYRADYQSTTSSYEFI